jgi:hypothetical protein
MPITDGFVYASALAVAFWLLAPRMRNSTAWRATVTPLASIIGSGFLVAAPLLAVIVGNAAPVAMLAIVTLAFLIGGVIRFNIRHVEPLLRQRPLIPGPILMVERISNFVLSAAYIVSVAFYVRLLASFVLHSSGAGDKFDIYANLLTTAVLAFIGVIGFLRGLRMLERLESISVTVKLAIIGGLLLGLAMFDLRTLGDATAQIPIHEGGLAQKLRSLAGLLLVVQGFETSRYLGIAYDPEMRIRTMRTAQLVTGAIYVVFALLSLPLLTHLLNSDPDETAIIELAQFISPGLPLLLVVAAVMSQFSAAVADTVGGGGLLEEATSARLRSRYGYLAIAAAAIALIWFANIFQIISLASRAFALYYLLQCASAWLAAPHSHSGWGLWLQRLRFAALASILAFVTLFGQSAD